MTEKEIWESQSQEFRDKVMERYRYLTQTDDWMDEYTEEERNGAISNMEFVYGKENLCPKPVYKTWDDVCANNQWMYKSYFDKYNNAWFGYDVCGRMIATAKITKLKELGYGGKVSLKDNYLSNVKKYQIYISPEKRFDVAETACSNDLVMAFVSKEYAQDFIKNNEELLKDYFFIPNTD